MITKVAKLLYYSTNLSHRPLSPLLLSHNRILCLCPITAFSASAFITKLARPFVLHGPITSSENKEVLEYNAD